MPGGERPALSLQQGESPTRRVQNQSGARVPFYQRLVGSCTGAIVTGLTMTPFDVVKSRLQAQNQPTSIRHLYLNGVCGVCGDEVAPKARFTGTMDAFVKIARTEGFSKLWRGVTPTLIMQVPGTVTYYSLYDSIRPWFGESYLAPAYTGSFARVFAATVVSPLELFRTKTQVSVDISAKEVYQTIAASVKYEGPSVLFRGLVPTLLRDVPFSAMYWVGYEVFRAELRERFFPHHSQLAPPIPVSFAAGALSGMIAATVTLPFDVVKTRQQSLVGEEFVACEPTRRHGSREKTKQTNMGQNQQAVRSNSVGSDAQPLQEQCLREQQQQQQQQLHETSSQQRTRPTPSPSPAVGGGRPDQGTTTSGTGSEAKGKPAGRNAAQRSNPAPTLEGIAQQQSKMTMTMSEPTLSPRESMRGIIRDIYVKHGWRGFFAGFVPRLVKVAPACAIMISSYEFFKQLYFDKEVEISDEGDDEAVVIN